MATPMDPQDTPHTDAAVQDQQPIEEDAMDCALDIMRRLPPQNLGENLLTLVELMPDHEEDLLSMIDQPLKAMTCPKTHNEFLVCDYNRDGDSFRSPWSNEYVPAISGEPSKEAFPSDSLRKVEQDLNNAMIVYRQMYYENSGITSAYLWSLDSALPGTVPVQAAPRRQVVSPFAAAILIKKSSTDDTSVRSSPSPHPTPAIKGNGTWDAIHVIEVSPTTPPKQAQEYSNDLEEQKKTYWSYRLTTTILLYLNAAKHDLDHMDLSGNISRQAETVLAVKEDNDHIPNIGRMVEEMENKLRTFIQDIYFSKTRDVINDLRKPPTETSLPKRLAAMPISEK